MQCHTPEILSLRKDIHRYIGYSLQSPNDFQSLVRLVWEKQHVLLSISTIKRLWGYIDSNANPRISTLNILSQFLDYSDWNAYVASLEEKGEIESQMFISEGVFSADLSVGDMVIVEWMPNRQCVFQYLGNNHYFVKKSIHSKLQVEDRFDAVAFIVGKPMYLDNLTLLDGTKTSYVAGKKHGITNVRLVTSIH